jgi:hypothetical protein
MGNHIVELALPVLVLIPHRWCNIIGGAVQILFQVRCCVIHSVSVRRMSKLAVSFNSG